MGKRYRGKDGEVFALVVTCLGAIFSLVSLFHEQRWTALLFSVPVAVGVFALYHLLLGRRARPVPGGWVFPGVGETSSLFDRKDQKEKLKAGILKPRANKVCVITGESGVGKSVLISWIERELKDEGWSVLVLQRYDHVKNRLAEFSPGAHATGAIVIFDQAEQLTSAADRQWVRNWVLTSLRIQTFRIAFVVRQDYYFDLKFLTDLLPDDVVEVRGVPNGRGMEYDSMREKLEKVGYEELVDQVLCDLETDNSISPLELQMVGFVLERNTKPRVLGGQGFREPAERVGLDTYRKLGGKAGAIKEYFMLHVNACPNKDIALTVLFALSTGTVGSRMPFSVLQELTYYSREDIEDVLRVFLEARLLTRIEERKEDVYQWAHDILPKRFGEISAADMDPALRDNLTYLAERRPGVRSNVLSLKDRRYQTRNRWMLTSLVSVALVLVAAKVGYVPTGEFSAENRSSYPLFAWAGEFLWGLFLYKLRWLYIRASTESGGISWWAAMPVVGTVCVFGTWLQPTWWLLCIALSAGVLGTGLLVTPCGRNLSKQSAKKFHEFGRDCIVFSVFVCLALGLINVLLGDTLKKAVGPEKFGWWLNYEGFVLAVVAWRAIRETNPSALTMYLGLLDRRDPVASTGPTTRADLLERSSTNPAERSAADPARMSMVV